MTRRRFLLLAGGTAAVALASGSIVADSFQPEIESARATYGGTTDMNERILVVYATKTGSTVGVAEAVGKELAAGGATVDLRPVKEVTDLGGYRAVVIGSAINGGKWLPDAMKFVETNQAALRRVPTAIFQVGLLAANPTEQNLKFISTFLEPVRAMLHPVAEGRFAGRLQYDKHSFVEGLGMRIFARTQNLSEGDYRDWPAIRAWANSALPLLMA